MNHKYFSLGVKKPFWLVIYIFDYVKLTADWTISPLKLIKSLITENMLNDFANQTGMLNSINTNDELKTLYKNY